ncbi:MAG: MBL fold metallo-hydrolase [Beijerinckiaceae bacterium]|nr:MBL fold metallo-hydrolase [Beijerinckiaceae bacterium]MDO9439525.1 MBL fold metallo-hydrolase [Beijerinckiaceae bacterium]
MNRREFLSTFAAACAVGSMTPAHAAQESLTTLSDGSFALPVNMLSSSADPARVRAALEAAGLSATEHRNPLNVSVLTRGDDVVIFDCGAGPNFMDGAGKLAENLAKAGIAPEKVKHVLFTHAHPDHLWGALDDFGTPAFPEATYHMAAAERDFWMSPEVFRQMPEDRQAFAAGAQRNLKELGSVLKVFKPGAEILPGVAAFETGGHTPGHVSFEVRVGSESLMVLGDALTHPVISFQHPDWRGGFDQEPDRAIATRRRLLDKLATERNRIVGYHLPGGGVGRVEKSGSAYRFVPA